MTRCGFCGTPTHHGGNVCLDCDESIWDGEPEEGDTGITLTELRMKYGDPLEPKKRPDGRWQVAA